MRNGGVVSAAIRIVALPDPIDEAPQIQRERLGAAAR
jgi:hypothetical protein